MRTLAIALATFVALALLAQVDSASAKSSAGYRHHHGKHHVHRHRYRHRIVHRGRIVVRHAYSGPAITFWQKRFEEPQGHRDFPYGYGTAYAPD
jgi:hypothetical protein